MAHDLARSIVQMAQRQAECDKRAALVDEHQRNEREFTRTRMRISVECFRYVTTQEGFQAYYGPHTAHVDFARDTRGLLRLKIENTVEVTCTQTAFATAVAAMLQRLNVPPCDNRVVCDNVAYLQLRRGHKTHTGRWSYTGVPIMLQTIHAGHKTPKKFDWYEIAGAIYALYDFSQLVIA